MAKTESKAESKAEAKAEGKKRGGGGKAAADHVRVQVARTVWAVCAVIALVLAVGALLVALGANRDNSLVDGIVNLADHVDLGVFSRKNGIFDFSGKDAGTKNALVNWGLAAVVWLVVGKVAERVIRP